jgi:flagellin
MGKVAPSAESHGGILGLRIATNLSSMQANRHLSETTEDRHRVLDRISSGERIVRAGDDAAGLAISEKLKAGIRSTQMAQRNTQDGISLLQTAEGGIVEVQNMVLRLRELSVQAASDTIGDVERSFTNQEFQHLKNEIQRIANTTVYDRKQLLNGEGDRIDLQVGVNAVGGVDTISYSTSTANITPGALGISGVRIDTKEAAQQNLAMLDGAIAKLGENRSYIGAVHTQLDSHIRNLDVHRTNLSQGNSRLRDADYAEWTAKATADEILQEAGNSVLVQANSIGKNALKLLEKG